MANKSFEIQESKLRLGGVDLEAGTTGVVIPGVTQAVDYFVEEVDDRDGNNPSIFGSDVSAVTVIDNAEYLYRSGSDQPSGSYASAGYSVDELDDGEIEDITVNNQGIFFAADKSRAEAGNMWATTTPSPFTSFNAGDWTQIPFRPKMRAGGVENVSGGGDTGDVTFVDNIIQGTGYSLNLSPSPDFTTGAASENGPDLGPQYFRVSGGDNYEHLHFRTSDDSKFDLYVGNDQKYFKLSKDGPAVIGTEATSQPYATHSWTFGTDGTLTFPDGTTQTQGLSDHIAITPADTLDVSAEIVMTRSLKGLIAVADSDFNFDLGFSSATGDYNGNTYAVGTNRSGSEFIMAFNPDGTVKWSKELADDNTLSQTTLPLNIRYNLGNNVLLVGYNCTTSTGVAEVDPNTGSVLTSYSVSTIVPNAGLQQRVIFHDVDHVFVGGRADGGEFTTYNQVASENSTAGGVVEFAWADLGSPVNINQYYGSMWAVDVLRNGTIWANPTTMCQFEGITPVQYSGTGGSDLTVTVAYGHNSNGWYYDGVTTTNAGTGYIEGDFLRIPGSQVGGVDSTVISVTGGTYTVQSVGSDTVLTFVTANHPNMSLLNVTDFSMWGQSIYGAPSGPWNLTGNTVTRDATNTYLTFVGNPNFPVSGDLVFVDLTNGNDIFGIYAGGIFNYYNGNGASSNLNVRFRFDPPIDFTAAGLWEVRRSLEGQAFVSRLDGAWSSTVGGADLQETRSIASSIDRNELYVLVQDYTDTDTVSLLVFNYTTGALLWQRSISNASARDGDAGTVLASGDYVYVVGMDGYGRAMVTKIDMANGRTLVWQKIHTDDDDNWDGRPVGAIASDGNIVVAGVYYEDDAEGDDVLAFHKLNADTGAVMFKTYVVDRVEDDDFKEYFDDPCQPFNIVNGYMYYGAFSDDVDSDYNIAVAVKLKDDGTGLGQYGRWEYMTNAETFTWVDNTDNASLVDQGLVAVNDLAIDIMPGGFNTQGDFNSVIYYNEVVGRAEPKITFFDESEISTAGIARHSVEQGGNVFSLTSAMNGKFIYFYGPFSGQNTQIIIPPNATTALPIGFTLTLAVGEYSQPIYVNNDFNIVGDLGIKILASGNSSFTTNYWVLAGDGNAGVYTIMKVDTNTWMLAGPNIQID